MRTQARLSVPLLLAAGALCAGPAADEPPADVIVIGLGPVGAFMSGLLASHGVGRIRAFESSTAPYSAPRAVSWDDYTVRAARMVGEELDVWMRWHALVLAEQWDAKCLGLKSGSAASRRYVVCEYPRLQQLWRDAVMATTRQPVLAFHQPSWERQLRGLLAGSANVEAEYGAEVLQVSIVRDMCEVVVRRPARENAEINGSASVLGNSTYRARYCIAADGGSSRTRKQLGLGYRGKTFPDQPWVVVDTEVHDEAYLKEAWFASEASGFFMNPTCPFVFVATPAFFDDWWDGAEAEAHGARPAPHPEGADAQGSFAARRDAALFRRAAPYMRPSPLRLQGRGGLPEGPHITRAATLYPPGTAFRFEFLLEPGTTEAEATSEAHVRRLLTECAEVDPDRLQVRRAIVYTFHARRAERWRVGPVLLAGDAAHCMPPFQGQGLNSGIRDMANLAWKLALVLRGVVGDSLLDSYEPERRANLEMVTNASIQLGGLVMVRSRFWGFVRDTVLRGLQWLTEHVESMERSFRGFMMDAPSIWSPDAVLADGAEQALAGAVMPSPVVWAYGERQAPVLLDRVLPPRAFALVWCEPGPAAGANFTQGPLAASDTSVRFLRALGAAAVAIAPFDASSAGLRQAGPATMIQGLAPGARCQDAEGPWTAWAGKHGLNGRLLVVRPDRYIFGVFPTVDGAAAELARRLGWLGDPRAMCWRNDSLLEPGADSEGLEG